MNKDWWKWGNNNEFRHLSEYPKMKKMLEDRWEISLKEDFVPVKNFPVVEISDKKKEEIKDIFATIPSKKLSFKAADRLSMAIGKSYFDALRVLKYDNIVLPDAILSPTTHDEVDYILLKASEHNVIITPFGGGTNVVGSLTNDNLRNKSAIRITINLREMSKLIAINGAEMTATFQSGILGPVLEKALNEKGYTLGHFPQSFEYSTLGGWIVTRSAGQASTMYGKIEDLVESLKVATPAGTIHTPNFTHDAVGINIMPLFFGSEGTLGIVTEATVKIKKIPRHKRWVCGLFPNFEAGADFFQEAIQNGVKPSVIRLSDANETALFSKLASEKSEEPTFFENLKKEAQKVVLKWKNLDHPCLMMMCLEQFGPNTASQAVFTKSLIEKHGGMVAPEIIGKKWEEGRFKTPYMRDTMMEHRIFVDTMETYVPWENVKEMHAILGKELAKSKAFNKEKGYFLAHISHVYASGACMYFTLFTPMQINREIEQWQELKNLIMNVFMENNGTISHHHGVGADHQKWYLKYSDPLSLEVLRAVKKQLDPKNILNPGKLYNV
jgi:alkyldihydroxyacetonephosphate synthase